MQLGPCQAGREEPLLPAGMLSLVLGPPIHIGMPLPGDHRDQPRTLYPKV